MRPERPEAATTTPAKRGNPVFVFHCTYKYRKLNLEYINVFTWQHFFKMTDTLTSTQLVIPLIASTLEIKAF